MQMNEITDELQRRLTSKRFRHSMGVCQTAVKLAERYNGDAVKARLAGILHDCAREVPNNHLLQMAQAFGIVMNDVEKYQPVLLHAPIGSELADREFGVKDPDILRAIALHTTGGSNMGLLDKIIYLADFIEPGRSYPGVDKLRAMAEQDLDKAVLMAFDQSLSYIVGEQELLHPATIEGRNELLINLK